MAEAKVDVACIQEKVWVDGGEKGLYEKKGGGRTRGEVWNARESLPCRCLRTTVYKWKEERDNVE